MGIPSHLEKMIGEGKNRFKHNEIKKDWLKGIQEANCTSYIYIRFLPTPSNLNLPLHKLHEEGNGKIHTCFPYKDCKL